MSAKMFYNNTPWRGPDVKKMRNGFEKAFVTEKETAQHCVPLGSVRVTWLLILIVLFCLVIELGLAALIFDVIVIW